MKSGRTSSLLFGTSLMQGIDAWWILSHSQGPEEEIQVVSLMVQWDCRIRVSEEEHGLRRAMSSSKVEGLTQGLPTDPLHEAVVSQYHEVRVGLHKRQNRCVGIVRSR